jgi:hypothetical protein
MVRIVGLLGIDVTGANINGYLEISRIPLKSAQNAKAHIGKLQR